MMDVVHNHGPKLSWTEPTSYVRPPLGTAVSVAFRGSPYGTSYTFLMAEHNGTYIVFVTRDDIDDFSDEWVATGLPQTSPFFARGVAEEMYSYLIYGDEQRQRLEWESEDSES